VTAPLASTVRTARIERQIRRAARDLGYRGFDLVFEHGHWWLVLKTGEIFDCVDAAGPSSVGGFAFESVGGGR